MLVAVKRKRNEAVVKLSEKNLIKCVWVSS